MIIGNCESTNVSVEDPNTLLLLYIGFDDNSRIDVILLRSITLPKCIFSLHYRCCGWCLFVTCIIFLLDPKKGKTN